MKYFKPARTLEQLPRRQKLSSHFWNFSWNFFFLFSIDHLLVNTIKKWITKLAKRYDELIFPNKLHLCIYCYMNNASSSIGLLNTLRMEGCNLFWVTPLPAFVHALSYDLFFPSDQFAFNFFLQRGQLVHQKYEIKKNVARWKKKHWLWHLNKKIRMLRECAREFALRHGWILCAVQDAQCDTRGITLKDHGAPTIIWNSHEL